MPDFYKVLTIKSNLKQHKYYMSSHLISTPTNAHIKNILH